MDDLWDLSFHNWILVPSDGWINGLFIDLEQSFAFVENMHARREIQAGEECVFSRAA